MASRVFIDQRALEYVAPYCDIKARRSVAPLAARVRGVAFRNITAALEETDKLVAHVERFGPVRCACARSTRSPSTCCAWPAIPSA